MIADRRVMIEVARNLHTLFLWLEGLADLFIDGEKESAWRG